MRWLGKGTGLSGAQGSSGRTELTWELKLIDVVTAFCIRIVGSLSRACLIRLFDTMASGDKDG